MKRYCKPSTMSCDQTGVTRWRTFAMHHQPRSPALRLQLWIQENLNSFVSPSTVNQILTKTVLLKCFQTSQFHSSFGSWKVPHLCPSVDTQVLVSSMWVPPTWVGNPSRMLGCSDGLKSMPPARRKGGCWKGMFFFLFFWRDSSYLIGKSSVKHVGAQMHWALQSCVNMPSQFGYTPFRSFYNKHSA